MSEPFSERCVYCDSPDVLDDAWFCEMPECWQTYFKECKDIDEYQERTPLTRDKARIDLFDTEAAIWGPASIAITDLSEEIAILARLPVYLHSI